MEHRRFPLGPLWTNTYLVWHGAGGILVDPAGDISAVRSFAEGKGIAIEAILLTHGHLDHVGGLPDALRCAVHGAFISEDDVPMVRTPDSGVRQWMGYDFEGTEECLPVRDGQRLSLGGMEVQVLATPGHTPGSVCYLLSAGEDQLLLSGDTLFARSVGRTDLPGGSSESLEKSLLKLAALPDGLPVLPGHGPETTIGSEREHNPFWPQGTTPEIPWKP